MAIGPTKKILSAQTNVQRVASAGLTSTWTRIVLAKGQGATASDGGPEVADAATIVNPATEIVLSTRCIIDCDGMAGQLIAFRLGYNSNAGTLTSPVVAAFGRSAIAEPSTFDAWQLLPNLAGDVSMTLTANATTDIITAISGTNYKHTLVDPTLNVISREGCDYIVLGVLTAFNAASGTEDDSWIECKEV